MNTQAIFEKVKECIRAIVPAVEIEEGSLLKKDLGLDSLSLVSVIVALEDSFHFVFEDADLDPGLIQTVKNLVTLVERYV
jgi:acyl carrier protein